MKFEVVQEIRSILGTPKQVFLLDNGFLSHRSFNAQPSLSVMVNNSVVFTGDIYSYLQTVLMIARKIPTAAIIICLDSRSSFRKELFPDYKIMREPKPEVYSKNVEVFETLSLLPSVYLAGLVGYEADDVIFTLAQALRGLMESVVVYSTDSDLYQCLGDGVIMASKIKAGVPLAITAADVKKKMGIFRDRVGFYKAIRGDAGDGVPSSCPRIPAPLVVWLTENYKDPEEFFSKGLPEKEALPKPSWINWLKKLVEAREILELNYKLTNLVSVPGIEIVKVAGSYRHLDKYEMAATGRGIRAILEAVR